MLGAEEKAKLEAEHGPLVAISHPDGSCFAFKRMTREEYDLREKRVTRTPPDIEADDRLLQERCVWPSREAWNAYVAAASFEVEAYILAYQQCHGMLPSARKAESDELPDGFAGDIGLTNGVQLFGFRKPTRVDVKRYRAEHFASEPRKVENLLRACSVSPEFGPWLDANLFAISTFGDALVTSFGMVEIKDTAGK